jgi:hypothetical protein
MRPDWKAVTREGLADERRKTSNNLVVAHLTFGAVQEWIVYFETSTSEQMNEILHPSER